MWDSREEMETVPPSATTAGAVIAQNAELAHGLAWVVGATVVPDGWDAICCSQLAGVARWTWSHNNGRPTGNVWPLRDRKSTRLNSSHVKISYAVFCLKKKNLHTDYRRRDLHL